VIGNILYAIAWVLVNVVARLFFRLRVIGQHHIPREGGVLIAANHVSYTDIPFLGCAMRRRANFIAKAELFNNPVVGWFYRTMGGMPIERGSISRDKLSEAIRRLDSGKLVVIYPEGARSKDGRLRPGMRGIGLIVALTGVPVVPAYISGTDKVMPVGSKWVRFHPVAILFGEPLDFSGLLKQSLPSQVTHKMISDAVMEKIQELSKRAWTLEGKPEKTVHA
jgi:1-acyl-sn-glycerol-3-phosphate acyltransferase